MKTRTSPRCSYQSFENKILNIDEIAQVLETPVDFVQNIQKELKKNPNLKK